MLRWARERAGIEDASALGRRFPKLAAWKGATITNGARRIHTWMCRRTASELHDVRRRLGRMRTRLTESGNDMRRRRDFGRLHRRSPSARLERGISDHAWSMEEIVARPE
jgi:hypothetical protein